MTLTDKQKMIFILVSVILLTLLGSAMLVWQNKAPDAELIVQGQTHTAEPSPTPEVGLIFHIKGAVLNEGVYTLTGDARLQDAIDAGGGLKEDADLQNVNLAMTISDGDEIYIPSKTDFKKPLKADATPKSVITSNEASRQKIVSNEKTEKSAPSINQTPKIININTATLEELDALKGIGPVTAQKIIDYRSSAPFKTIEDIKNVSGIGDKKFQDIKDNICVE